MASCCHHLAHGGCRPHGMTFSRMGSRTQPSTCVIHFRQERVSVHSKPLQKLLAPAPSRQIPGIDSAFPASVSGCPYFSRSPSHYLFGRGTKARYHRELSTPHAVGNAPVLAYPAPHPCNPATWGSFQKSTMRPRPLDGAGKWRKDREKKKYLNSGSLASKEG